MDKIIGVEPYTDYLYIKPVEKKQTLVTQRRSLFEVGEVVVVGPEAKNTKVGDYVAYEHWDMPDIEGMDGNLYCFIREKDAICKLVVQKQVAS